MSVCPTHPISSKQCTVEKTLNRKNVPIWEVIMGKLLIFFLFVWVQVKGHFLSHTPIRKTLGLWEWVHIYFTVTVAIKYILKVTEMTCMYVQEPRDEWKWSPRTTKIVHQTVVQSSWHGHAGCPCQSGFLHLAHCRKVANTENVPYERQTKEKYWFFFYFKS